MSFATHGLKKAASAAQAEIVSRVSTGQAGIPTFFDNFLNGVLTRLKATESLHGWNSRPATPTGQAAPAVAELQWLERYLENREDGRFVSYSARRKAERTSRESDIGELELLMSQGTASCLSWKGKPLFKTAFDFAILPMLIWELKPGTIFEIGSGNGASACWMADVVSSFGRECRVHSVDIKPVTGTHPGVEFRPGDCTSPETLFDEELLRAAPRPYLVLEDAHVNVHDVLVYTDAFLRKGDYLFVEDSRSKADDLHRFLGGRATRYMVDTRYTDFFGRNATCAANSILVRV